MLVLGLVMVLGLVILNEGAANTETFSGAAGGAAAGGAGAAAVGRGGGGGIGRSTVVAPAIGSKCPILTPPGMNGGRKGEEYAPSGLLVCVRMWCIQWWCVCGCINWGQY